MSDEDVNESTAEDNEESAETDAPPKAKDGLQADLAKERAKRHEMEEELNKLRDERTKAERKAMSESERLKAEYEDTKKLLAEATKANERLQTEKIRASLAAEFGLNPKLAKRISGGTEEEMRADAEELSAFNPSAPTEEAPTRKRPTNDAKKAQGKKVPSSDKPSDPLRAAYWRLKNAPED